MTWMSLDPSFDHNGYKKKSCEGTEQGTREIGGCWELRREGSLNLVCTYAICTLVGRARREASARSPVVGR
jgi:hypothetical protein